MMAEASLGSPAANGARRELRTESPERHPITTDDGVRLRLTRYRGGEKGPVLLVHCIGVSSRMYTLETIETNLVEYLVARGYDVWLLDFRLSIDLPASEMSSSFDEVAKQDYPAAVRFIRAESKAEGVHVVAHGVGSQTFSMAMMSGLEGVQSAVCSQVSTHLRAPGLNRFKAALRVPSLLSAIGLQTLTVDPGEHRRWWDQLLDLSLYLHPIQREEQCTNAVCRRITAFYGRLYEHAQLSDATHETLHEQFGLFNIRAFRHLIRNLNTGHIVQEDGEEAYLPHLDRLGVPITFIHGEENVCLLPESTKATYDALCAVNGTDRYQWHGIPGYGHLDCMIGHNAAGDVYPIILDHLERASA